MIRSLDEVVEIAKSKTPRSVVLVSAADKNSLTALRKAREDGFISDAVLIGNENDIHKAADEAGMDLNGVSIISADVPEEMAEIGARFLSDDGAEMLMKGHIETPVLFRAIFSKQYDLRVPGNCMAAVAALEIPDLDRLVFISDSALIPQPTLEQKISIIRQVVDKLHKLGYEEPKISVISSSETVNPKVPSMVEADILRKMNQEGELPGCQIAGPLSFDLSMSEEAAKEKGVINPIAGKADMLLFPDITSANATQKAILIFGHAKQGGFLVGTKKPIIMSSRMESWYNKYLALAFSVAMFQNNENI